jgi:hypothetical protein
VFIEFFGFETQEIQETQQTQLTNDYLISYFYFSFGHDLGKDPFLGHHAIPSLVVNSTSIMALFPDLSHP